MLDEGPPLRIGRSGASPVDSRELPASLGPPAVEVDGWLRRLDRFGGGFGLGFVGGGCWEEVDGPGAADEAQASEKALEGSEARQWLVCCG